MVLHSIQINNLVEHIQQHVVSFIPNRMYCNLKETKTLHLSGTMVAKLKDKSNRKCVYLKSGFVRF